MKDRNKKVKRIKEVFPELAFIPDNEILVDIFPDFKDQKLIKESGKLKVKYQR